MVISKEYLLDVKPKIISVYQDKGPDKLFVVTCEQPEVAPGRPSNYVDQCNLTQDELIEILAAGIAARPLFEQVLQFADNRTPIHPGSELVDEIRQTVKGK